MTKMDELIKQVNKDAKEEIMSIGLNDYNYKRIPFTSPRMNYCTYGGLPVGKLIEFYGEEHGGKTTTALDIVANYQHGEDARGVLYIDAENTLDYEWAKKLGVDVELMIMDAASYSQNMNLMLASGEQVDLFNAVSVGYMPCVNKGYTLDLEEDDLLQTYGQGILDTFTEVSSLSISFSFLFASILLLLKALFNSSFLFFILSNILSGFIFILRSFGYLSLP